MTGPDMSDLTRPRPDGCPSDLLFERRQAGELNEAHAAALAAHATSCPVCRVRLQGMEEPLPEETRDRLLGLALAVHVTKPVSLLRRIGIVRPILLAAMVAATVFLVVIPRLSTLPPASPPAPSGGSLPVVITKGGSESVSVFVQSNGAIRRLGEDDALLPGDHVQYALVVDQPSYGALYGRDSRGATLYVPVDGDTPVFLPAGRETLLQPAYMLDSTPGDELLVAVLCPQPYSTALPLARLEQWTGDVASILPASDCAAIVRVLRKQGHKPSAGESP